MLITFSPAYSKTKGTLNAQWVVEITAEECQVHAEITWSKRAPDGRIETRFTLPHASFSEHDSVIRALLAEDPEAEIRTAKAVYSGLAHYDLCRKQRRAG